MKIVILNSGLDAAQALSFSVFVNGSLVTVDIPAETGRTKTALSQLIVENPRLGNFVLNGTNLVGLVNDNFDNDKFTVLGEVNNDEVFSIGNFAVKRDYATIGGSALIGFILGRV